MTNGHSVYDERAEAAILGACILERRVPLEVPAVGELRREDFYLEKHRAIWEAMIYVSAQGQPLDPVTLRQCLRQLGKMKTAGGAHYLVGLATECPAGVEIGRYAGIVRRYAAARLLVDVARGITAKGEKLTADTVDDFLDRAGADIIEAQEPLRRSTATTRGLWDFGRLFGPDQSHEEQKASEFIPTGIYEIDRDCGGWPVGVMSVIGALPAVGKTALALTCFAHAVEQGHPAVYASCEDKASKLAHRLVKRSRADDLRDRKAWILDLPRLTPSRLRIHLAPLAREGVRLVFVDHAQRLRPDRKCNGRTEEVESISNDLCAVAADLNVALVVLSQLTRSRDWSPLKTPPIGSLKWAKALTEDARFVLMLGRAEHQLESNAGRRVDYRHPAWFDVAKNSEGPTLIRGVLMYEPKTFAFVPPTSAERSQALSAYGQTEPWAGVRRGGTFGDPM
jgi:replicative DNA helicase